MIKTPNGTIPSDYKGVINNNEALVSAPNGISALLDVHPNRLDTSAYDVSLSAQTEKAIPLAKIL